MLVLPQLHDLLTDRQLEQWQFPPESVALLKSLIKDIEDGKCSV
jgi:hypothetical protein